MDIELEVVECVEDIIATIEKREKKRLYMKEWREQNKEKIKLYDKEYRENNKEKIKQNRQSPERVKSDRIANWRKYGIIVEDWDGLYYRYLSTAWCDNCRVKLTYDKQNTSTTKVVDHCHISGEFRNILCHSCNVKRK